MTTKKAGVKKVTPKKSVASPKSKGAKDEVVDPGKYKGLLSPSSEKKVSEIADHLIKTKGLIEKLDGPTVLILTRIVDNRFGDKLGPQYEDKANLFVDQLHDAIVNGNKQSFLDASDSAAWILAEAIPTPLIDNTPLEPEAYKAILTQVVSWLLIGKADQIKIKHKFKDA